MPVTTSNHHHNSKEGVNMIINTNVGSNTAARILANNSSELQKSLKRLSTGNRIASVSDDAAGMAVGGKLSAEVLRLNSSSKNLGNLISFTQTQDGYLSQISTALNRMSELAMLATDATKNSSDRSMYNDEFQELEQFIDNMSTKEFNGVSLFSGTALSAYIGADNSGNEIDFTISGLSLSVTSTGVTTKLDEASSVLTSVTFAEAALDNVQDAISELASLRSDAGTNLSRLEYERDSLSILRDNLSAARSRIMDVDVAEESANFAKQQILVQSGTAMLAQANILPQSALRLIS
jgi:flagellin